MAVGLSGKPVNALCLATVRADRPIGPADLLKILPSFRFVRQNFDIKNQHDECNLALNMPTSTG